MTFFFVHRKVVVRAQSGDFSGNDFIFACSRWLDDHEEDGKIERELQLSGWLLNISSCDTHAHTTPPYRYIIVICDNNVYYCSFSCERQELESFPSRIR